MARVWLFHPGLGEKNEGGDYADTVGDAALGFAPAGTSRAQLQQAVEDWFKMTSAELNPVAFETLPSGDFAFTAIFTSPERAALASNGAFQDARLNQIRGV